MTVLSRAQGCLLGQLTGDALGSLVEFQSPEEIRRSYPHGVRELADGGTWNTIAGQPTDDSEMALMLARTLVEQGAYEPCAVLRAYQSWYASDPFDCGTTIATALKGDPNPDSQANGALMRISPLGIFGINHTLHTVAEWASQDAALTHPNAICRQINALFAMVLSHVIGNGCSPENLYQSIRNWSVSMSVDAAILQVIENAKASPPPDYQTRQGWVLIAFQNALWQLLHAPSFEAGVINTVMQGGDTDTNAAICGALLGAVYGIDAVPGQWTSQVLNCRPQDGDPAVKRPRPRCYWPVDAMELAEKLIEK